MQHFTIQELSASASAERLAIDNTPSRAAQRMLTILVEQLLDPIRRRYGAPIIVTSGYRCPALNTAVGGVANSHHILGCAADIVGKTHPNPPREGGDSDIADPNSLPHRADAKGASVATTADLSALRSLACELWGGSFSLFHLIVQMQREGAIRFTQLIAEKDYRWLHISYVPGMLRNQIIDVNACASERDASSLTIAQRQRKRSVGCDEENFSSPEELRLVALQPSVCDEVTNDNDDDNHQPEGKRSEAQSTSIAKHLARPRTLTLSLEEKPSLTLKKDYQDSG